MNNKMVSFVIPVYHNEKSLSILHEKISEVFASQLPNFDLEIVFVNDGSTDGSGEELKRIKLKDKRVKIVSFTRNFGQMAAILAGFEYVTGDYIINVSADLQDPIEIVPQLVQKAESGVEIVIAHRE